MSEAEQQEMLDFQMHSDGFRTVHLYGSVSFITRSDQEASAYLKGITDSLTAFRRQKGKCPMQMKINIDMTGAEIRDRYVEIIDEEHTFGLFAFNSYRLAGSGYGEKLDNLLGQIIDHLIECPKEQKLSISFFIHPTAIEWEGSSGPAICVYIGCNDNEYVDGCLYDELNTRLRKMESYVCAEGYSPEVSPIFAYYDPDSDTLHIAREYLRTLDHAAGFNLGTERSTE